MRTPRDGQLFDRQKMSIQKISPNIGKSARDHRKYPYDQFDVQTTQDVVQHKYQYWRVPALGNFTESLLHTLRTVIFRFESSSDDHEKKQK
jgi:hypothetical protein